MRYYFIILITLLMLPFTGMSQTQDITVADAVDVVVVDDNSAAQEVITLPPLPTKPTGKAFIVISKKDLKLRVYDRNAAGDTIIVAQYPCCMGKNKGNKQKRGDMRTPESPKGTPFKITMIQDASTSRPTDTGFCAWRHRATAALASMAAPTTRSPFPAAPARAASACSTGTSSC